MSFWGHGGHSGNSSCTVPSSTRTTAYCLYASVIYGQCCRQVITDFGFPIQKRRSVQLIQFLFTMENKSDISVTRPVAVIRYTMFLAYVSPAAFPLVNQTELWHQAESWHINIHPGELLARFLRQFIPCHLALSQTASRYRSQSSLGEGWFPVRSVTGATLRWQLAEFGCVDTSAAPSRALRAGERASPVLFGSLYVPVSLWFHTH